VENFIEIRQSAAVAKTIFKMADVRHLDY